MKKTIRILIFAIVIQAVSGFGTIGLSNDTFFKYGEKALIKFRQLEQAEELLVLAPLPENAVAENVNIIKSNFFEDSEFILPDGTKPVGDCDLVEYNGERYIKIKSYTDPDFITALKLKYTGHSEIIEWIDEITNPELLSKLDELPTAAYTNLENDITSANALKEAFNSEPELVEAWEILDDANIPSSIKSNPNALTKVNEAIDEGLDGLDALEDALQLVSNPRPTWSEILQRFIRGNNFNRKARTNAWYDYHEIHLANGKRLDSYDPDLGEIISRKATTFDDIQTSTFENYLKELQQKYSEGTVIRSNKYPELDGKTLQGSQILEVPSFNQNSSKLTEFTDLASQYNITIRFQIE